MRPNAALEHRVPVIHQVMHRDGRCDTRLRFKNKIDRIGRGNVLENDLEFGKALDQGCKNPVDKRFFAVKDINRAVCDFAVHQQRQACMLHFFQRSIAFANIGYAFVGIGCCPGRVEFHALDKAAFVRRPDLLGRCVVGQVECHQRFEVAAFHGVQDAVEVVHCLLHGGDRRPQVRHHDGALKLFCRKWSYTIQYVAIT